MSDAIWIAPLLCIVVGGLAMMMVDAFSKERSDLATMSTATFVCAAGLAIGLWVSGRVDGAPAWIASYLATDRMALFFDVVLCLGGALTVLLAGGYLEEHDMARGEFYPIVVFSVFGAIVLARANDLLTLFLGLETMSLGVYSLVGFRRTSPRATEGALKYFLLGSFAAALLLFGSALLYGATGHTDFKGIGEGIRAGADAKLVLIGLMLVLVGLAFKVSAVPFHTWTPDAYEGAATPATTFMSVAVKAAVFGVFLRVLGTAFADDATASWGTGWPPVLAGLAALTMVIGNLAAVAQSSVKRMLAYSSIAHAGYILVGVVASWKVGGVATAAVLYYVAAYTFSNVLAFGALIWAGSRGREAVSYEDLAGLGRRHPAVALPFVLGVLSLMGFPPTAGFFAKYYVLSAAIQAGGGMVWLTILAVLSSAIGAYYYLRVIVYLFMKEPAPGATIAVPMRSGYVVTALIAAALFVLHMGLMPQGYVDAASLAGGVEPATAPVEPTPVAGL